MVSQTDDPFAGCSVNQEAASTVFPEPACPLIRVTGVRRTPRERTARSRVRWTMALDSGGGASFDVRTARSAWSSSLRAGAGGTAPFGTDCTEDIAGDLQVLLHASAVGCAGGHAPVPRCSTGGIDVDRAKRPVSPAEPPTWAGWFSRSG